MPTNILGLPDLIGKPLAVFLIDLLLASDNALAIALICRGLPPRTLRAVLMLGTAGAIAARVVLAGAAAWILTLPGLKLAGAALLFLLALNLGRTPGNRAATRAAQADGDGSLLRAAAAVILIDVLMSLDNVLALAAVAGDSLVTLALGVSLSVAILMFGSVLIGRVLYALPDLARWGLALLGWIAGRLAVTDPVIAGGIAVQSPALLLVVPLLGAAYVFLLAERAEAVPAVPWEQPVVPPPRRQPAPRPKPAPRIQPAPPAPANPSGQETSEKWLLVMMLALFGVAGVFLVGAAVLAGGF